MFSYYSCGRCKGEGREQLEEIAIDPERGEEQTEIRLWFQCWYLSLISHLHTHIDT